MNSEFKKNYKKKSAGPGDFTDKFDQALNNTKFTQSLPQNSRGGHTSQLNL